VTDGDGPGGAQVAEDDVERVRVRIVEALVATATVGSDMIG